MTKVYIVSAENRGAAEKFIMGVYPTEALAKARMSILKGEDFGFDFAWYDEVNVGPEGADCEFCNR